MRWRERGRGRVGSSLLKVVQRRRLHMASGHIVCKDRERTISREAIEIRTGGKQQVG